MSSTRNFASVLQIVNVQTDSRQARPLSWAEAQALAFGRCAAFVSDARQRVRVGSRAPETYSHRAFPRIRSGHVKGLREPVPKRRPRSRSGALSPFPHITSLLQKNT